MSSAKHIGHQVINMMDRLGVSPITRNYHLFYTCIANTNPALRQAVRRLGRFPSQHELDQLIDEFCPEVVDSQMMARHENVLLGALGDASSGLRTEQEQMSAFHTAIERVTIALARSAERDTVTTELLMKVVGAISDVGRSRIAAGGRALSRMDRNRDEVTALKEELISVRKMANTDALTGLANRRNFDDTIAKAFGQKSDFALVIADIDHFKRINDAYGHSFGDHVLKTVAATLRHVLRSGTYIARTGGEEFAILCSVIDDEEAFAVAERMRQGIETVRLRKQDDEVAITISLGVALSRRAHSADDIYEAADAALYQSKNAGRNRTTLHEPKDEQTSDRYRLYGN